MSGPAVREQATAPTGLSTGGHRTGSLATYLSMLFNGPLVPADAIHVLSGDGHARLDTAVGLLKQRAAHWVVVSGGLDNPPHSLTAEKARDYLVSRGLVDGRIIMEPGPLNTHDEAEVLVELCRERNWARVLLVTSAYHMPRAYLTVLKSLQIRGMADDVAIIPVPAYANWGTPPDGLDTPRYALIEDELGKMLAYERHVASMADGVAYLQGLEHDVG